MKRKCIICGKSKGKRSCKVRQNEAICPLCCASVRDRDCAGCRHYTFAEQYQASKYRSSEARRPITEIDEEVENSVERALELIERQSFQQAEQQLRQLRDAHPRNYLIHHGLGILYAFQGQQDRAITNFEKAIELSPYFVDAHYNKAVAHQKKLEIRPMIESFQKVVEIGDPRDECVINAKDVLIGFERHLMTSEGITLAVYMQAMACFDRGFELLKQQKWELAIQAFQQSLSIAPRHAQPYGNIGLCYAQLGQKELALEAFDNALAVDPRYELALVNRVLVRNLKEGEKLAPEKMDIVEYYKDYPLQNRSYIEEFSRQLSAPEGDSPEKQ